MSTYSDTLTSLVLDGAGLGTDCPHDLSVVNSWHHINYTHPEAQQWLSKQSQVSDLAKENLLSVETRPRAIIDEEEVVLSLRGMNFNSNASPEDMISIRVWLKGDCMITSCNRSSRSINTLMANLRSGKGGESISALLLSLIDQLGRFADEFTDELELMLDYEEDNIKINDFERFHPQMNKLRRQIAFIKRYLSPQREALDRLFRHKSPLFEDHFYDQLYIYVDRFMFILEHLDLLKERAMSLQEQFMAYVGHQQNSRLYVLAIISALFLPLTFLSGLLGMNVGGMPGTEYEHAFWVVSLSCTVMAVVLLFWFKRKHWF